MDQRVSIGLRTAHIAALLDNPHGLSWLEIHNENWLTETGPIAERLAEIRSHFDLSLHGVGMSLGSADRLDHTHLQQLKRLVERCHPILVSEHLSWGAIDGRHSNDLLPLPFNQPTLQLLVQRIDMVQQTLGRQILVENLSSYCTFAESTMPEWVFVREVVERADCGLLLDINNLYVNAINHDFKAEEYLAAMPWGRVGEVHLAGYEQWGDVLVDTHGYPVQTPVWRLFEQHQHLLPAAARILIEWDTDVPDLTILLAEVAKARALLSTEQAAIHVMQESADVC
jgi:uncharacterized protein (UPF0276 family)